MSRTSPVIRPIPLAFRPTSVSYRPLPGRNANPGGLGCEHQRLEWRNGVIKPRATTTISAEPRDVITFIADPISAPRWMKALEVSELLTPGPTRPGTRFREGPSAGGQRIETICEVVDYDGETRYAWKSVSEGPAHYGGGFEAVAIDGGTELRY